MWIVTKIGFFNIIQYDEDKSKQLLTVKARSREDLENFKKLSIRLQDRLTGGIEESNTADYRFRLKAPKVDVVNAIGLLVAEINYPKTKPAISAMFPERGGVYLDVWDILGALQDNEKSTTKEQ